MLPQGMLPLLRGGAGEATSIPEPHSIAAPPHHAQPSETILTGTVMSCHVMSCLLRSILHLLQHKHFCCRFCCNSLNFCPTGY